MFLSLHISKALGSLVCSVASFEDLRFLLKDSSSWSLERTKATQVNVKISLAFFHESGGFPSSF